MYEISKRFHFSASHRLFHLPGAHPCKRLHGHNYEVEVVLAASRTDARGFVRDYHELEPFARFIDDRLDHRHIVGIFKSIEEPTFITVDTYEDAMQYEHRAGLVDELQAFWPATAEHMARALFNIVKRVMPDVVAVRVSETPKTWAEYREAA